jgi:hypothetical protein
MEYVCFLGGFELLPRKWLISLSVVVGSQGNCDFLECYSKPPREDTNFLEFYYEPSSKIYFPLGLLNFLGGWQSSKCL